MARLALTFLGPFSISLDGQPLALRSARIRALLAYLALEPARPHPREALAALFWPDEPDQAARQNLRQALYQLRQLLGEQAEPFVLVANDAVQRNAACDYALDVAQFLEHVKQGRLEAAVALYGAELLADLRSGGAPFEEWLALRREQLHILVLDALRQLAEQSLERGEAARAQEHARRQLAFEPWRELAHRQLMRALAAADDRSAALAQFEACRAVLLAEFGAEPEPETHALAEQIRAGTLAQEMPPRSSTQRQRSARRQDWGDAPAGGAFYGRTSELAQLQQWIAGEGCRLVAVLGMGGLGKTTLAAEGARRCADHFAVVIWRSLLNAPSLTDLLADWLPPLFDHQLALIPPGLDARLALLFAALRERRCLLVLDNAESIMAGGARAGSERVGYEDYGQLLVRVAQSDHQSCLLLTSREQPRALARLEADTPLVRSLALDGLNLAVGSELLAARGVHGPAASTAALVERYSGSPLALKLVAEAIREVFGGDVAAFLGDDTPIFDDIRDVLDQQFARLTPTERDLLRWLAIAREPLTEAQLWQLAARTIAKQAFLEAVRSLLRRSLLERSSSADRPSAFGLQNVVAEYVTSSLIGQVCHELAHSAPEVLHTHALILAHAREYVRQSQERTILRPIGERLLATHSAAQLDGRCKELLEAMRRERPQAPSFLAGNLLNLLLLLQIDLRGYDLSHRNVWGAYLRGADLPALNLAHANLAGSVFTDYAGAVTAVALSPDGQLLAAGADNGAISLWRTADRQLVGICEGHTSHVWSLAFGGEHGQLLASGSADTTVRIWDVERQQTLATLAGHTSVVSTVAFHPAGALVASGSLDQTVRLWDARAGQQLATLEAGATRVEAVAFSPDGALLATGGHDQLVHVWDWKRAAVLHTLPGHTNLVKALRFCPSPEGAGAPPLLASGGDDQTVRLWNTQTGAPLAALGGHTAAIITLAASADGRWLFSGSDDQTVRVWDLSPAWEGNPGRVQTARTLHGHYGTVRSLAVWRQPNTGETLLASGSYDKTVRLWDVQSGQTLAILRGHAKWLQALVFTPADAPLPDRLLVAGSDGQNVRVWDGETGRALHTLRGHTSLTEKIAFRADGSQLASAGWDQTVRVWSSHSAQTEHLLQPDTGPVAAVAFGTGADGRRLLASGGQDRSVRLWDGETGRALACLRGHRDRVVALAFSQNGALVASGAWDTSIGVWDTQRNELVHFLHGHTETVESIAFHPGGALLASASWDRSVRLWDVRAGQLLATLEGHSDGLEMVAFSPNGELLASCGCDHLVCVWEVSTGRLRHTLRGHTSWVRSVAWSPDGALLASASDDGTVKLWDMARGGGCQKTVAMDDPYTGMDITGATGISQAQRQALKALGAVDAIG